jgi:hypothetical protein
VPPRLAEHFAGDPFNRASLHWLEALQVLRRAPDAAQTHLDAAWGELSNAGGDEALDPDEVNELGLRLVKAQTVLDPRAAEAQSEHLEPWPRHLALVAIARRLEDAPAEQRRVLEIAAEIASAFEGLNRFHALANVGWTAEQIPDLMDRCLTDAVAGLDALEPRDRVVAHLHAIARLDSWPEAYATTVFEPLQADLDSRDEELAETFLALSEHRSSSADTVLKWFDDAADPEATAKRHGLKVATYLVCGLAHQTPEAASALLIALQRAIRNALSEEGRWNF